MNSGARTPWLIAACTAWACACEQVTSENIRKWEGTQKGPGKLEQAFANSKLDPRLRAEAALALENIEAHAKVHQIWQGLPEAQRAAIAPHLVAVHGARIEGAPGDEAQDSRDALFELRTDLAGEPRRKVDLMLAKALTKDLRAGRLSAGRHNPTKIAAAMAPDVVGPAVEDVLRDPSAPFAAAVEMVNKIQDRQLRTRAAAALKQRLQANPQQPPELWAALIGLGGPEMPELLKTRIRSASEDEALAAAEALRAVPPAPELLDPALELAADPQLAPAVREKMLALIESVGTGRAAEALAGLVKIIAEKGQLDALRYRAFATALAVGATQAVAPALEALPADATYKPEEVLSSLVQPVVQLGPVAREPLLTTLTSRSAIARLTGVLALERLGTPEDAEAVAKLTRDRAAPAGFPSSQTVGKEAARVAPALRTARRPL